MFEIEAHYHDRKIYLSDDRTYPLGEILLRYSVMLHKEVSPIKTNKQAMKRSGVQSLKSTSLFFL